VPADRAGAIAGAAPRSSIHRGVHLAEWGAELAGTMLLVLCGLSAVTLDFSRHSPVPGAIPSHGLRLLITGLLFAGSGALVVISPLGRLSGGHLNPAVSFAFWLDRKLGGRDLIAYAGAQLAGALAGALLVHLVWGPWADDVGGGATVPAGIGRGGDFALEVALTAALIATIFAMLSAKRAARWTPLVVALLVASFVRLFGQFGGPSMNPARSLGPGLVFAHTGGLWIFLLAPLLAAAIVALVWRSIPRELLTTKLMHDPRYRTIAISKLPAMSAGGPVRRVRRPR
jgi:aquaporin Z